MRIISQDGQWDIPYDLTALSMGEDKNHKFVIYAQGSFIGSTPDDNFFVVSEYSTEDKAKKAMDLLREAYMAHNQYNSMTAEQKAIFIMSVSEKESENLYGLFYFPADDEIEV